MRQVRAAAQRRDLHDERVATLPQRLAEVGLEREVAREAADRLAVEPHLRAVVGSLEADLPEVVFALGRLGQRELLAIPTDRGLVECRVGGVPVVRGADRRPAREVALGVPALVVADEGVVGAEVPDPAEQEAVGLPLVDERARLGLAHCELGGGCRRRRRGSGRRWGGGRRRGGLGEPGAATQAAVARTASRRRMGERTGRGGKRAERRVASCLAETRGRRRGCGPGRSLGLWRGDGGYCYRDAPRPAVPAPAPCAAVPERVRVVPGRSLRIDP